jgi:DNA-binding MarR family transcriptional regulator
MSDVDPAEVAARFRTALIPLTRALRTQVEGDMTPSLMSALATVAREGPVTLGDLAGAEKVTPPMATKLANGLEERGLVERTQGVDDRRIFRLALAPKGRAVLDRAATRRNAWLARRLKDLSEDELAQLAAAVEVIEHINRHEGPGR